MIRVPIKLYYIDGVIDLDNNLNETPLITRLSNLSYRLYYYDINNEIGAVEATFQKPDGTQVQLPMVYDNTITNTFGTWNAYYCDITSDVTSMANSLGNNNLYVSFNCYDGYSNALYNTEAFLLHCTYAINNALVEFEMTPMEYYQYQYNLALSERALASQTVLHINHLPTPSSSNNGFIYLLEQDSIGGDYLKGDLLRVDNNSLVLVCNKPNTITLNATSGVLNNTNAYNYARRENTIIIYKNDDDVEQFYQVSQDNDEIIYRSETQVDIDTDYNSLKYSILTINKSTKAYSIVAHNDNFYNKTESDTLLALKENVANKATDFTNIDNTKYPTTKAVDDFFEGKIEETAYYPVVVEANFEETITLSNDVFNELTQKDNVVLVWVRNDKIMSQMFKDYSISTQTVYYGTATYVSRSANYFTVRIYKCTIDNTNQTCRITEDARSTYDKNFLDTKLSEYLLNASASGDTLTINGIYNGSGATTTFDVSHKLDKDFSGVNYNEATTLGQNDYFVINVGGTPKKVSFQTIFTALGLGTVGHCLGTYNGIEALQEAHPTASAGDYAYIATEDEEDPTKVILTMAIWDDTDNEWQVQDLSQYVLESVFQQFQNDVNTALANKSKVTLVEWS